MNRELVDIAYGGDYYVYDYHGFDSFRTVGGDHEEPPLIGLEIEVKSNEYPLVDDDDDEATEEGGIYSAALDVVSGHAVGCRYLHTETDGSIGDGFEIVTNPASRRNHEKALSALFRDTNMFGDLDGSGHDFGLHVHISKDMGGGIRLGHAEMVRMLCVLDDPTTEEVRMLARRGYTGYCYDSRIYDNIGECVVPKGGDSDSFARNLLRDAGIEGKYYSCNSVHTNTMEFRLFQSTTDFHELMVSMELCLALCRYAVSLRGSDNLKTNWREFKNWLAKPITKTKYGEEQTYLRAAL